MVRGDGAVSESIPENRSKVIRIFYTGFWDLLHIGHKRALEAARALGDHLTVGINTDRFAEQFKPKPIWDEKHRLEMVASLKCVDEVVFHRGWMDNIGFMQERGIAIRAIGPEHGKQHERQVWVRKFLESKGVRYVVIPWLGEFSTTRLIQEILKRRE